MLMSIQSHLIMKNDLAKFRMYFIDAIKSLGDEQLTHELDILDEFRYTDEIGLFFF